jgi:hypothetical protein
VNTLATISNPYVLLGQPSGGQQKDLMPERRATNNENNEGQDDQRKPATEYILRGELLDAVINDPRYAAQHNENVDPQNRNSISQYLANDTVDGEPGSLGRLIDRYI